VALISLSPHHLIQRVRLEKGGEERGEEKRDGKKKGGGEESSFLTVLALGRQRVREKKKKEKLKSSHLGGGKKKSVKSFPFLIIPSTPRLYGGEGRERRGGEGRRRGLWGKGRERKKKKPLHIPPFSSTFHATGPA